jgi:hypothetical protein
MQERTRALSSESSKQRVQSEHSSLASRHGDKFEQVPCIAGSHVRSHVRSHVSLSAIRVTYSIWLPNELYESTRHIPLRWMMT